MWLWSPISSTGVSCSWWRLSPSPVNAFLAISAFAHVPHNAKLLPNSANTNSNSISNMTDVHFRSTRDNKSSNKHKKKMMYSKWLMNASHSYEYISFSLLFVECYFLGRIRSDISYDWHKINLFRVQPIECQIDIMKIWNIELRASSVECWVCCVLSVECRVCFHIAPCGTPPSHVAVSICLCICIYYRHTAAPYKWLKETTNCPMHHCSCVRVCFGALFFWFLFFVSVEHWTLNMCVLPICHAWFVRWLAITKN